MKYLLIVLPIIISLCIVAKQNPWPLISIYWVLVSIKNHLAK